MARLVAAFKGLCSHYEKDLVRFAGGTGTLSHDGRRLRLVSIESPLQVQRDMHQADECGHFDQRTNDSSKGNLRSDAEHTDCNGDCEFEVIACCREDDGSAALIVGTAADETRE
jgi:hypothetical protein